jgi:hypothetical protein
LLDLSRCAARCTVDPGPPHQNSFLCGPGSAAHHYAPKRRFVLRCARDTMYQPNVIPGTSVLGRPAIAVAPVRPDQGNSQSAALS